MGRAPKGSGYGHGAGTEGQRARAPHGHEHPTARAQKPVWFHNLHSPVRPDTPREPPGEVRTTSGRTSQGDVVRSFQNGLRSFF